MEVNEIKGNLITLAENYKFDVITHGCNCFCRMGSGIAPQMAKAFKANDIKVFTLENSVMSGEISKLGNIQIGYYFPETNQISTPVNRDDLIGKSFAVINSYTQYDTKPTYEPIQLDYSALRMCLKKINHQFKGKHIGLPLIGCGLASGDWNIVKKIIREDLKNMDVTIVHFDDKYLKNDSL